MADRRDTAPAWTEDARVWDDYDPSDTDGASSPAKWFHFILADEWDPTRGKLVRKVVFPQRLQNSQALQEQILRPERHCFMPRNPGSQVTLGRHVLGMMDSRFISTSRSLFGSPRFEGRRHLIDEQPSSVRRDRSRAADIVADLDRIAAKNANRPASSNISRTSSARAWSPTGRP